MLNVYLAAIKAPDDKDKFQRIYDTYRDLMLRVAYRLLENQQDAEDAVQQAFLSIVKNMYKLEIPPHPKTKSYVLLTTESRAIDILRKRPQDLPLDEECVSGLVSPLPGDRGLADAMARLPARYRQVLLLRYDNDLSNRQIGNLLNMQPGTVQVLLWRAKQKLRTELEKEGIIV